MSTAVGPMWRSTPAVLAQVRPGRRPAAVAAAVSAKCFTGLPTNRSTGCCTRLLNTTAPRLRAPPPPPPVKKKRAVLLPPLNRSGTPRSQPSPPYQSRAGRAAADKRSPAPPLEDDTAKEPLDRLVAQRRLPLIGAGLAACVLGFFTLPLAIGWFTGQGAVDDADPATVPTGVAPIGAAAFDASLDVPERIMGLARQRRRLAAAAHGRVLEVAVGTGRNLSYYPWVIRETAASTTTTTTASTATTTPPGVTAFTGIDLSDDALALARRRLRTAVPGALTEVPKTGDDADDSTVHAFGGALRLLRADAMQPLPPATPAGDPYDTIVQTFGLCSVADPVTLIAHMAAAVAPGSGRIVLLEHGRGRWSAVNAVLDRFAGRHCARYGCWWNRDMAAIVAQAQQRVPGLEVVRIERPGWFQFGTLWWIELRVAEA